MGKHNVRVIQLKSSYDGAFLNVGNSDVGSIDVWSSTYAQPTYLMVTGHVFRLVVFANKEWERDGLEDFMRYCDRAWQVVEGGLEEVDVDAYKAEAEGSSV